MHEARCSKLLHWDNLEAWDGGREVGGGSGAGDTCTPMADSCQCLAKPTDFPVAQMVKNLRASQETRV